MKGKSLSFAGLSPASLRSSKTAARIRSSDTKPEMVLRKAVWRAGLRYRKNVRTLHGTPDMVFAKARLVVFCDGDFWHGKNIQKDKRRLRKGSNSKYWISKIEANAIRDKMVNKKLVESGWQVLRFWESDILKDADGIAEQIISILRNSKQSGTVSPAPTHSISSEVVL